MTRVALPSLGPRVFVDDEPRHTKTLAFQRTCIRPPLSAAERTPLHFACCDRSYEALELEVRSILAARYAETSPHAAARHGLAKQYLDDATTPTEKSWVLEAFDRQNIDELEESRLAYECKQLGLDEQTIRLVRAEVRR